MLDVSYNLLESIPPSFVSLKEFYAAGNPLSTILPAYRLENEKVLLPFVERNIYPTFSDQILFEDDPRSKNESMESSKADACWSRGKRSTHFCVLILPTGSW